MHPTKRRFVYALFNISLGFFLCSFMVHEKSILLVTMPATMLVLEHSVVASWFIGIANFRYKSSFFNIFSTHLFFFFVDLSVCFRC